MDDFWAVFCCELRNPSIVFITDPSSCANHVLMISFDAVLLAMLLFNMIQKVASSKPFPSHIPTRQKRFSTLQLASSVFNCGLGFVYLCLGAWILVKLFRNGHPIFPMHWWILAFWHGLTLLSVGLTVSLRGKHLRKTPFRLLSILAFLSAAIIGFISIYAMIYQNATSFKAALDTLSFLGGSLLLLCTYKGYMDDQEQVSSTISESDGLFAPLITPESAHGRSTESYTGDGLQTTSSSFAKAGFFSRMSFWWLNTLMRKGSENLLNEKDIPRLRDQDTAEACFSRFKDQLNKQKQTDPSCQPSIMRAIIICHWKEILLSGFFAFLKIITLSLGPLLLNAFIEVAEGNKAFENEGYFLAASLFFSKCLESVSQRQWYFRSRLMGLKVRSLLSAAIYRKQLRLSNTARMMHSGGEIMNYITVDAYRIGEFPFWLHQMWTTSLQLCIALFILFHAVGLATIASLVVIIITVLCNAPLAKLQHKFQTKLMDAQGERLKASLEALVNIKVLKLYAWETHFKNVIEALREEENKWLSVVLLRRAYSSLLFWSSPVLVSTATFGACYFLEIPLHASNVFTFVATLRLVQDPVRAIPDVIGMVIQAKVAFARIVNFLEEAELQSENVRKKKKTVDVNNVILMKSADLSWEKNPPKPTLRGVDLEIRPGEKVAVCGEVGSGKSTLLSSVLGEVPFIRGMVQVFGNIAYVSQTAWIQTGTIRENILFGSALDDQRYQETLERCSLVKDIELLPHGDLTEIGERGVNLSGGQKQRIQLARALYQDADIYLLDDPFSAVDAHTATNLFSEYVMGALSNKTVLLVTHQVDFLPAFDYVLFMSDGEILRAAPYNELLASSPEFLGLVDAHKKTAGGTERMAEVAAAHSHSPIPKLKEIESINSFFHVKPNDGKSGEGGEQLIKKEQREVGDQGLRPYMQYLNQNKGYVYFCIACIGHFIFMGSQIAQNSWMAANVDNPHVSVLKLILVYLIIGFFSLAFLLVRSVAAVTMGMRSSKALFSQLLNSLFHAPMSFYDSTPLGRILSRVSSDVSIVDLDIPFNLVFTIGSTFNAYSSLAVLAVVTWQVLLVSVPVVYLAIRLQKYYFTTAKELMRINGTTKSLVANHLAESVAGAMTIRAFEEEDRFFSKSLELIDANTSPFFHNFATNEWLIQRLEILSAAVLSTAALCMVLLPSGTFSTGFIGMALSYGLSLSNSLVWSIQNQCMIANYIISVERLNQYMHVPSEAAEVLDENRPPQNWPAIGKVEIQDLQVRYRPDSPLVLRGISCTFEGGSKIGIVGRTGSGKSTLVGALFRLVEPAGGKIVVDGINICSIGLHDLRSRFGIIPQDPTLFNGTVRFNLDPLSQHSDEQIWAVLEKCQLREAVQEKDKGLDSVVVEDGSNWSMGQRQLFCLGRALLRRCRVLVLDEATASIDNATDMILQKTIRTEFADCTVVTVAHRIPTVMDCTMVLSIRDGYLVEYDKPVELMKREGSLFGELVKEYWSHINSAESH